MTQSDINLKKYCFVGEIYDKKKSKGTKMPVCVKYEELNQCSHLSLFVIAFFIFIAKFCISLSIDSKVLFLVQISTLH